MTTVKLQHTAKRRTRLDAFKNMGTGLGVEGRDKRMGHKLARSIRLTNTELDLWYAADAIFAKIVDELPQDMTRAGVALTIGKDPTAGKAIADRLDELDALGVYDWGLKLARIHGGSVVLLGVDDGQAMDQPLDLTRIRAVNYLMALDRWQISPLLDRLIEDHKSPSFGKPEFYQIHAGTDGFSTGAIVHHTRLQRFDGVRLTDRETRRNNGWGDTVGTRLYGSIQAYHTAHDAAATIVDDFTQAVYKLKGLAEILEGDTEDSKEGTEAILTRMRDLDASRSIVRALVMDLDEDFAKLSTNVSGLDKLLESTERRLTAESGMPHTKLLGESPGASLGEGGTDQERNWYDFVATKQDKILRKPMRALVELLMLEVDQAIAAEWSFEFNSLWQLDDKEAAEVRYIQAKTDQIYLRESVIHSPEVAQSRFGGGAYSTETVLDKQLRDELDADPSEGLDLDESDDEEEAAPAAPSDTDEPPEDTDDEA